MASRQHTGSAGYSRDTVIPEGHESAGAGATQNVAESPRDSNGRGQRHQEYTQCDSTYRKCKPPLVV